MKISVAQTKSIRGDVAGNLAKHKILIDLAASCGSEMVIFPELSLTGYEPEMAKEWAADVQDNRFDGLQAVGNSKEITLGAGMPIRCGSGTCIGMLVFAPKQPRQMYAKQYLHPDEEAFFVRGDKCPGLMGGKGGIALAICYELSVTEHARTAFQNGADVYVASVAKTEHGVAGAMRRLSEIAKQYSMIVLMANGVGGLAPNDCGGCSAIWDRSGSIRGQLDSASEGVLTIDTESQEIITKNVFSMKEDHQTDPGGGARVTMTGHFNRICP